MQKFIHYCLAFVVFGLVSEAHARSNEWAFIERPTLFTDEYATTFACSPRPDWPQPWCFPDSGLRNVMAPAKDLVTGEIWVTNINVRVDVICRQGYCYNQHTNEYMGRTLTLNPALAVPWGHYVYEHDGKMYAHRRGTGPLAIDFPEPVFLSEQERSVPTSASVSEPVIRVQQGISTEPTVAQDVGAPAAGTYPTFNVWCSPQQDLCDYTDEDGVIYKLSRDTLIHAIPISPDTNDCIDEFCYDADMEIIGLNPNVSHLRSRSLQGWRYFTM